jgi:hypothetical protein
VGFPVLVLPQLEVKETFSKYQSDVSTLELRIANVGAYHLDFGCSLEASVVI